MDLYCWNENTVLSRAREESWTLHGRQVVAYKRDIDFSYEFGLCLEIDLITFDCYEVSFYKYDTEYFSLKDKWTTNLRVREDAPYALDGQQDWNAFSGGLTQSCIELDGSNYDECTVTLEF